MCVLIIGVRWHAAFPLFVAANRDEDLARPAGLPESERYGRLRLLRPLDTRAGGTWVGINSQGLMAVITNRRDGTFVPERRSRGLLCREALGRADTHGVDAFLRRATRAAAYNSFNLLYADAQRVCLAAWNGRLQTQELGPGVHVLSNLHGLGELHLPELDAPPPRQSDALRTFLVRTLASHTPRDASGFPLCKHGDRYGTVSSTLLLRDRSGPSWMEHAAGPPCRTPFQRYDLR